MKAVLLLEDGTLFEGTAFGARGERVGEVVFNTSMMGYQEILTDPSYKGQIVTMTYPLIGNYGVNREDMESFQPHVEGFVVREYSERPSNWRADRTLRDFLVQHGIIGLEGLDTRALTRRLRVHGVMLGILSTEDLNPESLKRKLEAAPRLEEQDLVALVSTPEPYVWQGDRQPERLWPRPTNGPQLTLDFSDEGPTPTAGAEAELPHHVVAFDFGVKYNSLRRFHELGCRVTVVPARTTAEDVLRLHPDGVFLSNGPGDPKILTYAIDEIRKLIGKVPLFGICLGHQLLGWAFGGRTYKLKFGHRGGNQPVKNLETGRVEITSQNHGFAVDADSIPDPGVTITHINLNDQTVEGMRHENYPILSVQYHPEASPGPHDADYLFRRFVELLKVGGR